MSELAKALVSAIDTRAKKQKSTDGSKYLYGIWMGAESVDANLSKVLLTGDTVATRFVPKLGQVTGLTVGDNVICYRDRGMPLTIHGRVVGDITLAS